MKNVSVVTVVAVLAGSAAAAPVLGDYTTYRQISNEQITMIALDEGIQGTSTSIYSA